MPGAHGCATTPQIPLANFTDRAGATNHFTYDGDHRLLDIEDPRGVTPVRNEYDDDGRLVRHIDAFGKVIELGHNLDQRREVVTNRLGASRVLEYGRRTSFLHDPAGRPLVTTYPDGSSTTSTYDNAGALATSTDARGGTTTHAYDGAGRRTSTIDPLGNGLTLTHDESGNQSSFTDARGNTASFTYDALGRLTTTTHADGTTSSTTYDALGRRVAETDQAGVTTEFDYDPLGRLIRVKDALEQVTSYTYDEVGNRDSQTDANGRTTRFEYDLLGRRTARILPDGSRESMAYNAGGTLASHTDFNGVKRTFEYDANRRLVRRAYPSGSDVTFTYTPTNQRATATDGRGTTSYTYDVRNRLVEKADPAGNKLSYTYDAEGSVTRLTATVGTEVYTMTYSYDAGGRLTRVTDSQAGESTLGYDPNGNWSHLALPNSITTSYTYDAVNRLTALASHTPLGDVLQSYQYTLGPTGNRTGISEHDGTSRHYAYDDLYRLTQDRVTDQAGELVYQRDFTYDSVGNRLQQVLDEGGGPTTVASSYDTRDRLLTKAAATFGWDSNGNLTSKTGGEGATFRWDNDNRLTSVTLGEGTLVEITYDADGNRVRTAVTPPGGPTTAVDHLVDTSGPLSHVVADIVDGRVQTLYTRAGDELIGLYRAASNTSKYYHADGLGSVRLMSDEAGAVTDRYVYTAFGELLEHGGADLQPYRFAGEPYDSDIGFYHNRARWLYPAIGRFVSLDIVSGSAHRPLSLHRYLYASADPPNRIDPAGTQDFSMPSFSFEPAAVWEAWSNFVRFKHPLYIIPSKKVKRIKVDFDPGYLRVFEPVLSRRTVRPWPPPWRVELEQEILRQIRRNFDFETFGADVVTSTISSTTPSLSRLLRIIPESATLAGLDAGGIGVPGGIATVSTQGISDVFSVTQAVDDGMWRYVARGIANVATHELGHTFGIVGHYMEDGYFMTGGVAYEKGLKWKARDRIHLKTALFSKARR